MGPKASKSSQKHIKSSRFRDGSCVHPSRPSRLAAAAATLAWVFLGAAGPFCVLPGVSLALPGAPQCSLALLVLRGAPWRTLAHPGTSWCSLVPPGEPWCSLALCGAPLCAWRSLAVLTLPGAPGRSPGTPWRSPSASCVLPGPRWCSLAHPCSPRYSIVAPSCAP